MLVFSPICLTPLFLTLSIWINVVKWSNNQEAWSKITATDYKPRDYLAGLGVSGSVRGTVDCGRDCSGDGGGSNRHLLLTETETFRVPCSERVRCGNAFRMGSSKSSCTTNASACACVELPAPSISWSADSSVLTSMHYLLDGCLTVRRVARRYCSSNDSFFHSGILVYLDAHVAWNT